MAKIWYRVTMLGIEIEEYEVVKETPRQVVFLRKTTWDKKPIECIEFKDSSYQVWFK